MPIADWKSTRYQLCLKFLGKRSAPSVFQIRDISGYSFIAVYVDD